MAVPRRLPPGVEQPLVSGGKFPANSCGMIPGQWISPHNQRIAPRVIVIRVSPVLIINTNLDEIDSGLQVYAVPAHGNKPEFASRDASETGCCVLVAKHTRPSSWITVTENNATKYSCSPHNQDRLSLSRQAQVLVPMCLKRCRFWTSDDFDIQIAEAVLAGT